jgi:ribosomal protein S18 acetylase RimI-like enzyme
MNFDNPFISIATKENFNEIVTLLNSAYRGEDSKKGWTTEANLIAGNTRANKIMLEKEAKKEASIFLKYVNTELEIIGCVNLQKHVNKIYLGMFAVKPILQNGGIGKALMLAAEEYAKQLNAVSIYMTVISLRETLINWYQRLGYVDTNMRKPFIEDGITGKHLQELNFAILEKKINYV